MSKNEKNRVELPRNKLHFLLSSTIKLQIISLNPTRLYWACTIRLKLAYSAHILDSNSKAFTLNNERIFSRCETKRMSWLRGLIRTDDFCDAHQLSYEATLLGGIRRSFINLNIDRLHKWLPKTYSFVYELIRLTSLVCMDKIQ